MRLIAFTMLGLITFTAHGQLTISIAESDGLVALFSATRGPQWKDRTGWLGEPGTECEWYGVLCAPDYTSANEVRRVVDLRLQDNGLRGVVPDEVLALTSLESAWLWNNALEAVPATWLEREDRGELDLRLWGNPLRGRVTQISIEESNGSQLCAHSMTLLAENGDVTFAAIRCRNRSATDRATFCEMRKGGPYLQFRRLARFVDKSGFFGLKRQYTVNQTHATNTAVRVVRDGKQRVVEDYGHAEPLELFAIQQSIFGVIADFDWSTTTRHPESVCWSFFERDNAQVYSAPHFDVQLPAGVEGESTTRAGSGEEIVVWVHSFTDRAGLLLTAEEGLKAATPRLRSNSDRPRSREIFFPIDPIRGTFVRFVYEGLSPERASVADAVIDSFESSSGGN